MQTDSKNKYHRGAISWMANNPVAANIFMFFLLVGGIFWGMQIKQEVFPEFSIDQVNISVAYPGASPDEIEKGILLPIEEAIQGIDGIEEVNSTASEGTGFVKVDALISADINLLYQDIKNEIDRINSFPDEAEEPTVVIPTRKNEVITVVLYGNQSDHILRETAEDVRDQLLRDKEISQVELLGEKPLEMSIEIKQDILRVHGLTTAKLASIIKNASLDLPGGSIKTSGGEILVRVKERKDYKQEFENIPVITSSTGAVVRLGEIATVKDGFEDTDQIMLYNNQPAIGVKVYRVGDQTPISVSDNVQEHIKKLGKILPAGIKIDYVNDRSEIFKQRIDLLLKNGYLGLLFVFILLGIFLEARLAFWVTMGIPISFLGSLLIIPHFGTSINMISLFAFIITLGIVVDDTIVIGENVYSYRQKGYSNFEAAIKGAKEVAVPVTFSIITNIVTFMPMFFVPGMMGKIFKNIPVVVASVFIISLIEALFILPAHLGHQKNITNSRIMLFLNRQQQKISSGITNFIHNIYGPTLKLSLRFRYVTVALSIVILLITLAYVKSGRMGLTMFPKVESDLVYVSFELPFGSSVENTKTVMNQLLVSSQKIIDDNGGDGLSSGVLSNIDKHTGWIMAFLTNPETRPIGASKFAKLWREQTGPIAGLEKINFQSDFGGPGSGAALTIKLSHRNIDILESASDDLAKALKFFPIVSDIDNGFSKGKVQLDFVLNEKGYRLGLTPRELAIQIRSNYYGAEVLTQLRMRNEIKIMVRLPENERKNEQFLDDMIIITPEGGEVPLMEITKITRGNAYTTIKRVDGRRIIRVTSDVNPQSKADSILKTLTEETYPGLMEKYPGLQLSKGGKQQDMQESMAALGKGMIMALLVIYVLLTIPFKSYIQPSIIMMSIPFGIVGAVMGHLIMGFSLSILSMFGMIALSGVVVNDSLVLIDFANRRVRKGSTSYAAIVNAGIGRFRPIILTTLTTFFGLMPMIFETSRQARFLIPIAISLGFGIVFATFIILVLVPALYIIIEDLKKLVLKILYFFLPPA